MILGLFTELTSPGGVQYAARQTCAALAAYARERHIVYRFLGLNDGAGEHEFSLAGETVQFRGFARAKSAFIAAALRAGCRRPEFVVAGHPHLAPVAAGVQAMSRGASVIAMCHGIEVWKPLSAVRLKALRQADRVTAPSKDTAEKLACIQQIPQSKITRLPWSLDSTFRGFAAAGHNLPVPAGFPDGTVVLSVGRWDSSERYKGVDHLIQAVARLRQSIHHIHLVTIGSGDDLPRLRKLSHDAGIGDRAHFLQGLSREEIAACYSRCSVFALPSAGEGFGFVFLEAMAFGKPVIGGAHGGTPDIIEDGSSGFLVPHGNVSRLTAILGELLANDHLRTEMGNRSRQIIEEKFLFPRFQSSFTQLLEQTCES